MKKINGPEDLASQIEFRKTTLVEKDSGFVKAGKRVEEFKLKEVRKREGSSKIMDDIASNEKRLTDDMLVGQSVNTSILTSLRQQLRESQDEELILKSVVERSTTAVENLKAEITKKFTIENVHLLDSVFADLCSALDPLHEKIEVLRTACTMPYLKGDGWNVNTHKILDQLEELEKIVLELQRSREITREAIGVAERM